MTEGGSNPVLFVLADRPELLGAIGGPEGTRTPDLRFRKAVGSQNRAVSPLFMACIKTQRSEEIVFPRVSFILAVFRLVVPQWGPKVSVGAQRQSLAAVDDGDGESHG